MQPDPPVIDGHPTEHVVDTSASAYAANVIHCDLLTAMTDCKFQPPPYEIATPQAVVVATEVGGYLSETSSNGSNAVAMQVGRFLGGTTVLADDEEYCVYYVVGQQKRLLSLSSASYDLRFDNLDQLLAQKQALTGGHTVFCSIFFVVRSSCSAQVKKRSESILCLRFANFRKTMLLHCLAFVLKNAVTICSNICTG